MDYKEKYEMALERAKCLYSQHEVEWTDKDIEYIFPELKKSEDERLRKELVNYFTEGREFLSLCSFGRDKILAWLEKQGEKPADKKELKKIESQQAEIQKWSEEDEDNLTETCVAIRKFYHGTNGAQELIDWLKSISPQNRWKPSNEQIKALRWVLNNIPYNKHKEEISGLLDQIKEL